MDETYIFNACNSGNLTLVEYLVKTCRIGMTPLFKACMKGHENRVKYLVEHGIDVNVKNNAGESPLLIADKNGHKNIVEYLIGHEGMMI